MLQIKTDLYRYVHYTSNVAVCNYQEIIGCDVSFMVVLISERHGGLFYNSFYFPFLYVTAAFAAFPVVFRISL